MLTPDKIKTVNNVKISEFLLTTANNNPNKIDLPPKRTKPLIKITIHNTDDLPNVHDDAEQYTRATYNGNMGTVVPTFYLDDVGAWQLLPEDQCNWTNTDGSGPGNTQTIAIECIMTNNNDPEDRQAYDNCARLAAYLLNKHGLNEDDIVTHTYWLHVRDGHTSLSDAKNIDYWCTKPHSYKTCPYYIIPVWSEFKALTTKYYRALKGCMDKSDKPAGSSFLVRVIDPALNIRSSPGTDSNIVGVINGGGIYTIIETQKVGSVEWGKLKSGAGWISLGNKYAVKL